MNEEHQKDLLSSQIFFKVMHLAVPNHDVLAMIFKKSDECFHSIG